MSQNKVEKTIKVFNTMTLDYDVTEITRYTEKAVPSKDGTLLLEVTEDAIQTRLWVLTMGVYKKVTSEILTKPRNLTEGEFIQEEIEKIMIEISEEEDRSLIQDISEKAQEQYAPLGDISEVKVPNNETVNYFRGEATIKVEYPEQGTEEQGEVAW